METDGVAKSKGPLYRKDMVKGSVQFLQTLVSVGEKTSKDNKFVKFVSLNPTQL